MIRAAPIGDKATSSPRMFRRLEGLFYPTAVASTAVLHPTSPPPILPRWNGETKAHFSPCDRMAKVLRSSRSLQRRMAGTLASCGAAARVAWLACCNPAHSLVHWQARLDEHFGAYKAEPLYPAPPF